MTFRHKRGDTLWIDLEKPGPDEVRQVMQELGIGKRIEEELLEPSPLPISASDGDTVLLVMHFPAHINTGGKDQDREQEVDFVLGRNFLLTMRYEVIVPLHALHKALEAHELLGLEKDLSADKMFEMVCSKLFDSVRDHSKYAAGRMAHIERDMFEGNERKTVRAISEVNREFLHLEAALADNEEPLESFLSMVEQRNLFDADFAMRRDSILSARDHLTRLIQTHRAVAAELQETNGALLSASQNEVMKTLTVITFVFLPLSIITGLFQMNIAGVPLQNTPNAFWYVSGAMLVLVLALTLVASRKRWL